MTKRTRLISYLLHRLNSSALVKKNTRKTPEVIFHIRFCTLAMALFFAHTKEVNLYASFSSSYWKFSCYLSVFVVSIHELIASTHNLKDWHWAEKNFHNARSLQENNARPAASKSVHTIVAIITWINNCYYM